MNPLSIGKSIFVCLIKIINYLGYEKNDIHFMHSDRFAFGLLTIGMQGNPAAVQAGAAIGGVLGAIVGDRAGGYNGSQFGAAGNCNGGCCGKCHNYASGENLSGGGVLREDLSFFFAV